MKINWFKMAFGVTMGYKAAEFVSDVLLAGVIDGVWRAGKNMTPLIKQYASKEITIEEFHEAVNKLLEKEKGSEPRDKVIGFRA